jgi:hypothetical protein
MFPGIDPRQIAAERTRQKANNGGKKSDLQPTD